MTIIYSGWTDDKAEMRWLAKLARDDDWLAEQRDECAAEVEEIELIDGWLEARIDYWSKPAWQIEAEAEHQEFLDVKFGSKQWWKSIDEIPF